MDGDFIKVLLVVGYIIFWVVSRFIKGAAKNKSEASPEPARSQRESYEPQPKRVKTDTPGSIWEQIKREYEKAKEELNQETEPTHRRQKPARPATSEPASSPMYEERRAPAAKQARIEEESTLREVLAGGEPFKNHLERYDENSFEKGETVQASSFDDALSSDIGIGGGMADGDLFAVYGDIHAEHDAKVIHAEHDDQTEGRKSGDYAVTASSGSAIDHLRQNYSDEQLMVILSELMSPYADPSGRR